MSYVIVAPMWPETYSEPDLLNYQNLMRAELARLGFHEAENGAAPALTVTLSYSGGPAARYVPAIPKSDNARVVSSSGSAMPGTARSYPVGPNGGFQAVAAQPQIDVGGHNRGPTMRELEVSIRAASDGKQLFRVNVHNRDGDESTDIFSIMLQNALVGFPGVNGTVFR